MAHSSKTLLVALMLSIVCVHSSGSYCRAHVKYLGSHIDGDFLKLNVRVFADSKISARSVSYSILGTYKGNLTLSVPPSPGGAPGIFSSQVSDYTFLETRVLRIEEGDDSADDEIEVHPGPYVKTVSQATIQNIIAESCNTE
jgi:hypothetical protein